MKELAGFLVRNLVDEPDKVSAQSFDEEDCVRVLVRVADQDKGKVIGKQGKVIKAIRAVVGIAAGKVRRRAVVDLE